jgi:3'-phosphoadenosine 5'-phosphosulfate sulfotransferase (PAPS reductase)/FAD synthetase
VGLGLQATGQSWGVDPLPRHCACGQQQRGGKACLLGGAMRVDVLVPVSGGKDSQACLKLAVEKHGADSVLGLFCDTQWEHPKTYAHVESMRRLYGARIERVTAGSVEDQCLKHGRFPSQLARFCTEELKIWPTKRFCKDLAEKQGGFEVWYGMRSDESPEREQRYVGKVCDEVYPPHEVLKKYPQYLHKLGVSFRLAVLDWSRADVVEYVGRENLNPLYGEGFDRVGCFPCEAGGEAWRVKAYQHDEFGEQQHRRVINIAQAIGKPVFRTKKFGGVQPSLNFSGCAVCAI